MADPLRRSPVSILGYAVLTGGVTLLLAICLVNLRADAMTAPRRPGR